jgi:hypothetical protein
MSYSRRKAPQGRLPPSSARWNTRECCQLTLSHHQKDEGEVAGARGQSAERNYRRQYGLGQLMPVSRQATK